jgi:YbbR domain-containing protein
VKVPRGVRLVRAIPSEVRLIFEQRRSLTVPVRVRFSGDGQNGYVVSQYEATPRVLRIVGPRSRVARVAAVVTDPVDVSTVVGTSEFRVNVFMDDPFVRFQETPQVAVTVTMKKK